MKPLIILGTGGNCVDILDTINELNRNSRKSVYRCIGFLDDNEQIQGREFYGVKVIGPLESAIDYRDCFFVNGIGSHSNFWKKSEIIAKTNIPSDRFETLIHPTASVSEMSALGFDTVILQNVTIASNVTIGNHVIILPNSIISHDSVIGDFTCITGGVCVSGETKIGQSCYLGTNSTIIGNISIGNQSLIGMGSVVLDHVPENSVMVGNPAKLLRNTV